MFIDSSSPPPYFPSQDMNNSKLFSDEAANIYERAIGTLLKKNMLLYFAFADYEEVSIGFCTKTK